MNNNIEKNLKKYYRNISRELSCDRKEKQDMLNTIKGTVKSYQEDHPSADIDEIISYFGNPGDIAQAYYDTEMSEKITEKIKTGKKMIFCVIAALTIALVVYIMAISTAVIADLNGSNGHFSEPVIENIIQVK